MMTRLPAQAAEELPDDLNADQRQAVSFGIDGEEGLGHRPLLIIAGAGTGKTHTLAHRVARLLLSGADPGRLLLLTFSRRAASELARRVEGMLAACRGRSTGTSSLIWSGTFHSVGARLLREYAGRIGLDPAFTIHDRQDSADFLNLQRHQLGLSARSRRFPLKATCLAIYSAVVNTQASLDEVLHNTFPWCREWQADLKRLFLDYVEAKQAQQVLDYDDLLLYWAQMVGDPDLAREIGGRFSHLLVDEYQDTNRLQASILLAMKPDGRGLTVVGDDAQAIYAFRGATVRNILDFPQHFHPPAQRLALQRNYRSTQPILAAANAVIALASEGFDKNLWSDRASSEKPRLVALQDDAAQALYIVEQVLARREAGILLKSQAVLFRAAHHSARLEWELGRRNIPFVKYGGLKFLEAAHVKDVLAMLRWLLNPRDQISGFRALQLVAGVGPRIAGRMMAQVAAAVAGCVRLGEQPVPENVRLAWGEFAAVIDDGRPDGTPWPALFDRLCVWYEAQLERLHADPEVRRADIEQLGRIAAAYPHAERFLTDLTLDPPEAGSDEAGAPLLDEDYLILSTMHSAKGQEWTSVSVLNVVDGCIPSDMATGSAAEIEEERRLLYVAMTRARQHLELIIPQRFYLTQQRGLGDRHIYAGRSRFLPDVVRSHFEQVSWPPPTAVPSPDPQAKQRALDLAARMRAMWQ